MTATWTPQQQGYVLFFFLLVLSFTTPQGADVNAKDKDEISGLMEASIMGHVAVVKELLKVKKTVFSREVERCVMRNRLQGAPSLLVFEALPTPPNEARRPPPFTTNTAPVCKDVWIAHRDACPQSRTCF